MNDTLLNAVLLVGVMALAARALLSRQLTISTFIGSLLIWGALGLVLFVGFKNSDRIDAFFARVTGNVEQRAEGGVVEIRMARDGHFWATTKLNGHDVRMLIDSGATKTAISLETANAAGIAADTGRPPVVVETANGTVEATFGAVDKLEVGSLVTRDIDVLMAENFGESNVLGMNFLSRMKSWRVENRVLILEPYGDEEQ